MSIFVSGLLNIETTVAVSGFPVSYSPIDYAFFGVNSGVAGVGYNIIKALSTLGGGVEAASFIAPDAEGERILRALAEDGIETDGIKTDLRATPTSVILYDPSGRRKIYCDLKDIQEQNADPDDPVILKKLSSCDLAALCNINFNRPLLKKAKEMGKRVATDVHVLSDLDDDYNRAFMEAADILFLSDEGLPDAPQRFIRRLYERYHNDVIVIGMGEKGAMLLDTEAKKIYQVSAVRAEKIVNTVGAGDALFSAFLHFTVKGDSPLEALKKAMTFASIKIGFDGASKGFCDEKTLTAAYEKAAISVEIVGL